MTSPPPSAPLAGDSLPPSLSFLRVDLAPFAGRFVALVEGRVVAVGESAEAARARARISRPQRSAVILYVEPPLQPRETGMQAEPDGRD